MISKARRSKPNLTNPDRLDPTRTLQLRKQFAVEMARRYARLGLEIQDFVGKRNAFGLGRVALLRNSLSINQDFTHLSPAEKIRAFSLWLRGKFRDDISRLSDDEVIRKYVQEAYAKGNGRAFDDTRRALGVKGPRERSGALPVLSQDYLQGTRDQFVRSVLNAPVSVDKVKLIIGRTWEELDGLGQQATTQMTRILADGLVTGEGPDEIARELRAGLGLSKAKAESIAQDAIVRAHNEGQLSALDELGVEDVGVSVEWAVTRKADGTVEERVCQRCLAMAGVVLKIDEARGMLPAHNRCRCAWIPANVGEDTSGQKRSKRAIDQAIDKANDYGDEELSPGQDISADRPQSIFNETSSFNHVETVEGVLGLKRDWMELYRFSELDKVVAENVFCPTGEGGGIDPTCSPDEGGYGGGSKTPEGGAPPTGKTCGVKECTTLAILRLTGRQVPDTERTSLAAVIEIEKSYGKADLSLTRVWRGKTLREFQQALDSREIKGKIGAVTIMPSPERLAAGEEGHIMPFIRQKLENVIGYWDEPISWIAAWPAGKKPKAVRNVFCPTGEGGGIDPTCSPSSGGSGGGGGGGIHPSLLDRPGDAPLEVLLTPGVKRLLAEAKVTRADVPLGSATGIGVTRSGEEGPVVRWPEGDASVALHEIGHAILKPRFLADTPLLKDLREKWVPMAEQASREWQSNIGQGGRPFMDTSSHGEMWADIVKSYLQPSTFLHLREAMPQTYQALKSVLGESTLDVPISDKLRNYVRMTARYGWSARASQRQEFGLGDLSKEQSYKLADILKPDKTEVEQAKSFKRRIKQAEKILAVVAANVFCPTGPGGGVDPTCSLHGGGPHETPPPKGSGGGIPHDDVLNTVADTRNEWGYKEPMSLIEGEGREFEVGGRKWKEAGNCALASGFVTIYDNGRWGSTTSVQRVTAHEMMHGTFEKVKQKYENERSLIHQADEVSARIYDTYHPNAGLGERAQYLDEKSAIYASGQIKPQYASQYPTYTKMWKHMEESTSTYINDDGVTPYSEAYWRDFKDNKVPYEIAIHETLAEIAGIHVSTGKIVGSKAYRDLYKATRDEYKVLTGQKKRRVSKVSNVASNAVSGMDGSREFAHLLYLDENFEPTTEDRAVYLRWWRKDGSNGYAVRADGPGTATNVFCPTGPGGGIDPTCSLHPSFPSEAVKGGKVGHLAAEHEKTASHKRAKLKIKAAPVPTATDVAKARADLRSGGRAGGEARGGSAASRRKQRENLFNEWGGNERGYVVCPWTGLKMHWTDDRTLNPNGYPKFERGKIFLKIQGGGYKLPNLIPESFTANRSRNDKPIRPENLP